MPNRLAAHSGLIALEAPSSLDPSQPLPSRIVMLKWGENQTAQGPVIVGLKTLAASQLWDDLGFGEVAIDFNHNTVPGHPSYKGEPAPIAAMAALSVKEGEGLVFDCINWTPDGITNRANYPDLSPTVKLDPESGEVIFCHSAAACRNGAVKGLHLFSAESIAGLTDALITLSAMSKEKTPPTHSIKTPTVHKPGQFMLNSDLLKKVLKLPADATDDDVNAALEQFGQAAATADNPTDADTATDPNNSASAGGDMKALTAGLALALKKLGVTDLVTKVTSLEQKLSTFTADTETRERQAIVGEAEAQGKQVPDEWLPDKDGKGGLPPGQLRTLCATLPEIIPLSARTPRTIKTPDATGGLSPADREVMRTMGISEEAWKKHNAA